LLRSFLEFPYGMAVGFFPTTAEVRPLLGGEFRTDGRSAPRTVVPRKRDLGSEFLEQARRRVNNLDEVAVHAFQSAAAISKRYYGPDELRGEAVARHKLAQLRTMGGNTSSCESYQLDDLPENRIRQVGLTSGHDQSRLSAANCNVQEPFILPHKVAGAVYRIKDDRVPLTTLCAMHGANGYRRRADCAQYCLDQRPLRTERREYENRLCTVKCGDVLCKRDYHLS
jgi:hypothetical protein